FNFVINPDKAEQEKDKDNKRFENPLKEEGKGCAQNGVPRSGIAETQYMLGHPKFGLELW
ncbi:hypothetical protein KI387_032858, partial [Taxus chinensis]